MQQEESSETMSNNNGTRNQTQEAQNCPRCDSGNTKFCYYNNYSLSQPRYFCKACRRYWTHGGTLRNVPIGGGSRKRPRTTTAAAAASTSALVPIAPPVATATTVAASAPPQPMAGYFSPFEAIQAAPAPAAATAMSRLQGLGDMSNPFGQFYMMNNAMLPSGGSTSSSSSHQAWRTFNNLASSSNNNNNNNNGAETAVWNLGNYSGAPGSHQWPDSHLPGSFGFPPA